MKGSIWGLGAAPGPAGWLGMLLGMGYGDGEDGDGTHFWLLVRCR